MKIDKLEKFLKAIAKFIEKCQGERVVGGNYILEIESEDEKVKTQPFSTNEGRNFHCLYFLLLLLDLTTT